MYSFIRELSYSQSFPPTGFISKTFRSKIDFFRYNQLPPIKEEEGNSGQNDIELRNFPLCSQTSNGRNYKRGYKIDRGNLYGKNERKNLIEELTKSEISARTIPALVNINCLMNVDMKQQSIWKTSFGKRLINEKSAVAKTISLTTIKNPKQDNEKLKENRSSDLVNFSQSFFSIKNIQLEIGDEIAQKKKKTKPVQASKKFRKTERKQKKNWKQNHSETDAEKESLKTEPDRAETSQETDLSSSEFLINSLVMSRRSRNHNFLSHCVQNILGGVATQYTCKYCDEIFTKVEDLNSHQEKHETEKETCVLCSKIFYNFKEFTEHLLTHESVDKFSCKDCKKYFPSLKKYKAHFKNVHLSLKLADTEVMCNTESTKEQTLKYVCKRCQLELDSEENFRDHRRHHIRFDLTGAYLLSNKSTLNY